MLFFSLCYNVRSRSATSTVHSTLQNQVWLQPRQQRKLELRGKTRDFMAGREDWLIRPYVRAYVCFFPIRRKPLSLYCIWINYYLYFLCSLIISVFPHYINNFIPRRLHPLYWFQGWLYCVNESLANPDFSALPHCPNHPEKLYGFASRWYAWNYVEAFFSHTQLLELIFFFQIP